MKELRNIKYWIFDLDNTLYSGQTKVFSEVDKKMSSFISQKFNVDLVEAKKIQKEYFYEYGTTLSGLMKMKNVDPNEFLEFVHDIDISWLPRDEILREELIKIKEKNPVFRVLNEKYYLDAKGKTMSLSPNYSETVPLILNRVESEKYTALGKLGYYIARDKFLRNHISSLSYADEKIVFGLNDYPFILKMDGFDNYITKFKNYQNFFLGVYSSGLLDSIKTVNLNFKNQVVIERK